MDKTKDNKSNESRKWYQNSIAEMAADEAAFETSFLRKIYLIMKAHKEKRGR